MTSRKSLTMSRNYSESESDSQSSDSDNLPADKYYFLNKKKPMKKTMHLEKDVETTITKSKTPLKVPKKPAINLEYNAISPKRTYKHSMKNMHPKDEELYHVVCANLDNIADITTKINKEIAKLFKEAQLLSGTKLNNMNKKIDSYEEDVLELKKLNRYYANIYGQLKLKYN